MMKKALLVFGAAAAVVFFVGLAAELYMVRLLAKPWPVLALLAWVLAMERAATDGRRTYRLFIATGLGFSALGDVLLELSASTFLYGVGAFLLAHVAYIVAFTGETRQGRWLLSLPFAAWGAIVVGLLRPGLEAAGMLAAVAVYTAVICAMMWRASVCFAAAAPLAGVAFGGALLFAASDSLIAVSRFSELEIPGVRWAIMALYWLGQVLIASSARQTGD